ncbi:MAG: AmmeMemoRadiSam system protein A [Gammaproteobacteria bacterium]
MSYSKEHRKLLLDLAKASIEHGLKAGKALVPETDAYPPELLEQRASFVTLEKHHDLRGCIGMLEATRPLVEDVAENAFSAAFRDPRFPPLEASELDDLAIHVSVLTPSEPIRFASERDLIARLRPGIDGLILADGYRRGTFLPSVWESLPEPARFLEHLKQKAGLPRGYWSETLTVRRYETEIMKSEEFS